MRTAVELDTPIQIAVVGSRDFTPKSLVFRELDRWIPENVGIVSGGARGPDSWGVEWAKSRLRKFVEFLPEWETYGKKAGFLRNKSIVLNSHYVIAFWDGTSKGTRHTIQLAYDMGRPMVIVFPDGRLKQYKTWCL